MDAAQVPAAAGVVVDVEALAGPVGSEAPAAPPKVNKRRVSPSASVHWYVRSHQQH
jgi:hypothetical protein